MKKTIGLIQICLLILASFAFSYIISETNNVDYLVEQSESNFIKKLRGAILGYLSHGLVSAQTGLWTCLEDVNGSSCQEYPAGTCSGLCTQECFPGLREDYSECQLGTCFDPNEGTCAPNSGKSICESSGGEWTAASAGVPAVCKKGCCLLSGQGQYTTATTCQAEADKVGITLDGALNKFDPTVTSELACIALSQQYEEGACVLDLVPEEGKFNCKFNKKPECASLGGEFHKDLLCSNPELGTICEKQKSVSCIEGKDELYWKDSCGNKENIYDSNKVKSWNDGKLLGKSESCSLKSGGDFLGNQKTCGNCNYLLGSVCGTPNSGDSKIVDSELGNFVCKDLSCKDGSEIRKNGESWCEFDSSIGTYGTGNDERSVDVPGSRHYRKVCLDGKVTTEACADFRNEICVENRDESIDFSSAACRLNQWQVCIDANTDAQKLAKCEEHTDCFLKHVELGANFKFDMCVPKNPPGFDLKATYGGDVGEQLCKIASQTCTIIEVKKLSGWKCQVNCDCKKPEFTETMNNLCISLGDCGGHINLEGTYSDQGYSVKKAPRLDSGYVSGLQSYKDPKEGQKVAPLTDKELSALFGVSEAEWKKPETHLMMLGAVTGLAGISLLGASYLGIEIPGLLITGFVPVTGPTGLETAFVSPGFSAAGSALAGAGIGAAVVSLALHFLGIDAGLDPAITYALVVAGAYAGGGIGISLLGTGAQSIFLTTFFSLSWVVGIAVVVAIIVFALLGIGKKREIKVEFSCLPWQPPQGGASCENCGKDGLPCSAYKCQSYGQTCKFVNEGTQDELCIDSSPNDSSAPIIKPDDTTKKPQFTFTEFSDGFKVTTDSEDGCIQSFTPVPLGIKLDEPGQCKVSIAHTSSYDAMDEFFGDSSLYKYTHADIPVMPSLDSLGVPGFDPDRRGEYNLYVRCSDASGNSNVKEYNINFCVSPADDKTPPVITKFVPETPAYAGFNVTSKFVQFYTNEPAECKWSLIDQDYELMQNESLCNSDLDSVTLDGWLCSDNLPITENENKYYFRCKDQPWLSADDDDGNDGDRNTNSESTVYTIKKSLAELKITSVSPSGTITSSSTPVTVDLEAHTSGGATGNAICSFSFNGESYSEFFQTGGAVHKQKFTSLFEETYGVDLMCKDSADNVATASTSFTIEVDDVAPEISTVYQLSGTLHVTTNEPAQCAYSLDSCNFNFVNGSLMSGTELEHTTSIEQGLTYKIKCKDNYDNIGACFSVAGGY